MYIVFNIDLHMTAAQPPVSFKVPARGQPARRLACCLFAAVVSPWQSCMGEGFSIKSKGATVCARKACLVTVQLCALSFFRSNRLIFWSLNPGAGLFARHAHAFGAAVDAPINRFWLFFFEPCHQKACSILPVIYPVNPNHVCFHPWWSSGPSGRRLRKTTRRGFSNRSR